MAEELVMNVKSNIKSVTKDTDELGKSIGKASDETKSLDKGLEETGKSGSKGFKSIGTAIKGVGTALKAAGIGLAVALMAKLMEVFSKNQKTLDAFDTAMESLSIAFNDLFRFLSNNVGKVTGFFKSIFDDPKQSIKDFGTAIKENLIERFNSLLDTFGHLGKAIGHLFKGEFSEAFNSVKDAGKESIDIWTGVDNSVDKLTTTMTNAAGAIKDYATETFNSAKATIELNKASELAKVQVQGLIEEYDRQAEKLRQTRDDETKTFDERIEANKKLGEVLTEQGVEMQKLVDIQVHAAQVEFNKNQSQENLLRLTEALNEKKAVEAQITGFQSEQLTNQVSLEKELGEVKKEVLNATLDGIALELQELKNSYEMQLEMARKAGEDTLAITEKYEKDKAKIVKENSKDVVKFAEMSSEEQLNIASSTAGSLSKILGEETEAGKAMAIVQATIDTYKSAQAAYASMAGIPVVGPALGGVAAAAAIASGIKNVQAIQSAGGGGGSGGNITPPATTTTETPAPQMMSGDFNLTGGTEPEPLKAFVITDEMSSSQAQLANIRRRATI